MFQDVVLHSPKYGEYTKRTLFPYFSANNANLQEIYPMFDVIIPVIVRSQ
jgi:hypothetical protein